MTEVRRFSTPLALLALLAGGVLASPAAAKSISISITPKLELRGGVLTATVRVGNSGDEAAQSVTPVLRFREQQVRGEGRPALGPKETMEVTLSLQVGELGTGRWPFRVAVDYTDANQYPFQALHMGLLAVGSPPPAKVAVPEITAAPLSGSGSIRVRVKNLAGVVRQTTVAATGPEGIEVTEPEAQVTLPAWGEETVKAPVVNRTALAGSRYPIFVTVSYEEEGVHHALIGQGMVEIVGAQSFFQSRRTLLWMVAAIVIVAWLGLLAWWAVAGRPRRAVGRS